MAYNYHLTPVRLKIHGEIRDKHGISESLNNIAIVFENQGDLPHALEYHSRMLKMQEEINDKEGISFSLNNIACIYGYQDDIPKALDYYEKSLKIGEEINNQNLIAIVLNNIGLVYLNLAQRPVKSEIHDLDSLHNKSMEYFSMALEIFREIDDNEGAATIYQNIGMVYMAKNDYSRAEDYFNKSQDLREKFNNKPA